MTQSCFPGSGWKSVCLLRGSNEWIPYFALPSCTVSALPIKPSLLRAWVFSPLLFQSLPHPLWGCEQAAVWGSALPCSICMLVLCLIQNSWKSIFPRRDYLILPFTSASLVLIPVRHRYWQKCLNKCFLGCGLFTTRPAPLFILHLLPKHGNRGLNFQQRISVVASLCTIFCKQVYSQWE